MMEPSTPIAAASHPDPYPYYRGLPQLAFDPVLGLWIARGAAVIEEVMNNTHCLVRPPAEAVPKAIAGTSAGAVFARLARMNEGAAHATPKRIIAQALATLDLSVAAERGAHYASMLGTGLPDGAAITRWMLDLPTYVVAHLLGFGDAQLTQVALWTSDFVRCLSPLSTVAQLASASTAAQALLDAFARLEGDGLAARVRRDAARAGWCDDDAIVANLVGLLSQTHEATAGLIGNCIVALLREPARQALLGADAAGVPAFVEDVARRDPPVQNTRRFVAQPTRIAGVPLQSGDAILLLLGATACAPIERKLPAFGHGRHACPGQALALEIAAGAVRHVLALPLPLSAQALQWDYAPSANGRLPRFATPPIASQTYLRDDC
jgi:cytochrome P450